MSALDLTRNAVLAQFALNEDEISDALDELAQMDGGAMPRVEFFRYAATGRKAWRVVLDSAPAVTFEAPTIRGAINMARSYLDQAKTEARAA